MSKRFPSSIQNLLLVLGSVLFTFSIVEGISYYLLRTSKHVFPVESPEQFEIWNFNDVKKFAKESGRVADIARLINFGKYEERLSPFRPTQEDKAFRDEEPSYPLSKNGNRLWITASIITPNLNEEFTLIGSESKRIKYKAHYTTDKSGRRKAWASGKKNIVFLGCSFTFGQGVNDENTFPYLVGEKLGVRTYNVGIPGSSPAMILKALREKTIPGEITDEETIVILTLVPEHLIRITGSILYFRNNSLAFTTHPFAYSHNGQIIIKDSFSDDPSYGKQFLYYLSRLNFPAAFGIDYPEPGKDNFLLMADIIKDIELEFRKKYPQTTKFIVSFFPTGNARVNNRKLKDFFISEKMNVFDFTFLNGPALLSDSYYLKYDGHPSPLAYELYSDLLVYELRKSLGN